MKLDLSAIAERVRASGEDKTGAVDASSETSAEQAASESLEKSTSSV
jgi:hypothetical protein